MCWLRGTRCSTSSCWPGWLLQGALYEPHGEDGEESLFVGEEGDTSRSKSGRYKLEYDLVPGHISHRLAEKIYFIG